MVGRGGFEPPKAEPTDLQSVPFGHSGISPASGGIYPLLYHSHRKNPDLTGRTLAPTPYKIKKAGIGTTVPDRLITNRQPNLPGYASLATKMKTAILRFVSARERPLYPQKRTSSMQGRFGLKKRTFNVRFTPNSGHWRGYR